MDFFSSIEFYIVAIFMAILLIGFFSKSRNEASAYSYIYQGEIKFAENNNENREEFITIKALENGNAIVTHHNIKLPIESTVNIKVDVCGDEIMCVEKMVERIQGDTSEFMCDVSFTAKCFKHLAYKIKYECAHNGKWCNIDFINNGVCFANKELKL